MSEPFLSEIRIFGFDWPPRGWATCDGQILPINQNQSLYSLLGTLYGGDGHTTFALPDLRGRVPLHFGAAHAQGQRGGEERHALSEAEMPSHTHGLFASAEDGGTSHPTAHVLAREVGATYEQSPAAGSVIPLSPGIVANEGSGQGHENRMPYLTLSFCIALQGLFPSRR